MSDNYSVEGTGVSKSDLVLQFWTYRRQFLARIHKSVFNTTAAEDIFQEACLKLLASKAVFPCPQAGTRYFCKILDSLIAEHHNRNMLLQYREHLPEVPWDPWESHARQKLAARVCENLALLPTKEQGLLKYHVGLKSAGRGRKMPPSTRHYRLGKVLRKLRTMMGE